MQLQPLRSPTLTPTPYPYLGCMHDVAAGRLNNGHPSRKTDPAHPRLSQTPQEEKTDPDEYFPLHVASLYAVSGIFGLTKAQLMWAVACIGGVLINAAAADRGGGVSSSTGLSGSSSGGGGISSISISSSGGGAGAGVGAGLGSSVVDLSWFDSCRVRAQGGVLPLLTASIQLLQAWIASGHLEDEKTTRRNAAGHRSPHPPQPGSPPSAPTAPIHSHALPLHLPSHHSAIFVPPCPVPPPPPTYEPTPAAGPAPTSGPGWGLGSGSVQAQRLRVRCPWLLPPGANGRAQSFIDVPVATPTLTLTASILEKHTKTAKVCQAYACQF